ncbi:hypothetical protein FF38_06216, partial [Lucilia cuprina]
FVPLCGKTVDLGWLRSQNIGVVACELSEIAVQEVFKDLNIEPKKHTEEINGEQFQIYECDNLKIYQGNFFALPNLGNITGIFDRAALVALPEPTRTEYTKYMMKITNNAKQLLITFEHERTQRPPHPISPELVENVGSINQNQNAHQEAQNAHQPTNQYPGMLKIVHDFIVSHYLLTFPFCCLRRLSATLTSGGGLCIRIWLNSLTTCSGSGITTEGGLGTSNAPLLV